MLRKELIRVKEPIPEPLLCVNVLILCLQTMTEAKIDEIWWNLLLTYQKSIFILSKFSTFHLF